MNDIFKLTFFATTPHPCSYLEGEDATTVFVDPNAQLDGPQYSELSDLGFRRSGRHVYRPRCQECSACVPIRIPVNQFKLSRSQKRCVKKNSDLRVKLVTDINKDEHYTLYEKYINERHADGDMFPPSREQFKDFLTAEWGITRYLEFRDGDGQLIAVSVTDLLTHGVSAIYFYFDPDEQKRSLGSFNVLYLISWAARQRLPYVFLGYWIKNCKKMSYKTHYHPFQVLINDTWITVSDAK